MDSKYSKSFDPLAVTALTQTGVKAVIAKSFAYIFQRNSPNVGYVATSLGSYGVKKTAEA